MTRTAIILTAMFLTTSAAAESVLLLPTMGESSASNKAAMTSAMRARLTPVVELVSEGETAAFMEGQQQLDGCTFATTACPQCSKKEEQCLESLAELSGVASIVFVDTKQLAAGTSGVMHVYSVEEKRVTKSVQELIRAASDTDTFDVVKTEQERCAASLVTQVYQPGDFLGEIHVVGPDGTQVKIDDLETRRLPEASITKVVPGTHRVKTTLENGAEKVTTELVVFGETVKVDPFALPVVEDIGGIDSILPIMLIGTGTVGAVLAAITTGAGFLLRGSAESTIWTWTPDDVPLLQRKQEADRMLTTGGVLVGIGIVSFLASTATAGLGVAWWAIEE